ncbi:MAG TPA: 1-acyl-sn-glycerol-3-phosphate acyltransferase [Deltaproteobacteria bacterium]|nr:1-acyl-sn-glycerol-3-phosphate acyltransferase [Deltaproteobacteria bacterium]
MARWARGLRLVGVTVVLSTYFATAPIGYGIFALLSLVPTRDPVRRARLLQWIMQTAFGSMHAVLRWMRILDFDPRKVEGEIPKTPCVLVANHPTLTDISAMLATEEHLVFPVKPGLFASFWARPLLAQAYHFAGAAPNAFDVGEVVDDIVDRLRKGFRVIIFPEGTRSPEGGLHPFGRTAFEAAVRAGVPIVPLVITCEPRWLSRGRSFYSRVDAVPRLRIRALPAVEPEDAGSSSRTLRDIVCDRIRSELGYADRHERIRRRSGMPRNARGDGSMERDCGSEAQDRRIGSGAGSKAGSKVGQESEAKAGSTD